MTALPIDDAIVLEVIGVPQPQGNKTGFYNKRTGRVAMVEGRRPESRAAFKDWRAGVAQAARDWQAERQQPLIDDGCRVTVVFALPRPKSIPKRRIHMQTRPDIEKLVRSVFDSLTGIIWTDDSRVVELTCRKEYAVGRPPGCTITIERLT